MVTRKKILYATLFGFAAIQFIQPARNKNDRVLPTDIQKLYPVPPKILALLQRSCYDCHSNNTHYPWYSFIQPGAWWIASHIRRGKADLNFSEFGVYSDRRQQSKLQAIANSIKDGSMPIWSYNLLHPEAKLSPGDKTLLMDWVQTIKDSPSLRN